MSLMSLFMRVKQERGRVSPVLSYSWLNTSPAGSKVEWGT